MGAQDVMVGRFEAHRSHLRAVAFRMLGSVHDADDAVQEAWLRFRRADTDGIENLGGWLTTVVARVCLDVLRSRASRPEESLATHPAEPSHVAVADDPSEQSELADAVGLALLAVLDRLSPPERVAFVLHDLFAVPFDEIAPVLGRSVPAAKKLASRARRRVEGTPVVSRADLARRRRVVDAFLAAARGGDLQALLAVLAPDVVRRADRAALPEGVATEVRGARDVAAETLVLSRGARYGQVALVDGVPGIVVAPEGRLRLVVRVVVRDDAIIEIDVVADQARLGQVELGVLPAA
ncbi:MAG TPA: sigma-70 family RNA polymerase sigma factor [Acidimicrobiales bacterium]